MFGRVLVRYCKAHVACLYIIGFAIGSPLMVNYLSLTIGVGQDDSPS